MALSCSQFGQFYFFRVENMQVKPVNNNAILQTRKSSIKALLPAVSKWKVKKEAEEREDSCPVNVGQA